jgi:hypothetical protein
MYKTTSNIAKFLFANGITHSRKISNGRLRLPTKLDKYAEQLTNFADSIINEMNKSWFKEWELINETTMRISYTTMSKDDPQKFDPQYHFIEITPPDTIQPPRRCESFQYNTPDDLNGYNLDDTITLAFQNKHYVKKEYRGKEIKFKVMGLLNHNWRRPTKRLSLVPISKINNFKESDILYLDDTDRFICLMIDLFGCNRIGYRGWKSKLCRIVGTAIRPYDFTVDQW